MLSEGIGFVVAGVIALVFLLLAWSEERARKYKAAKVCAHDWKIVARTHTAPFTRAPLKIAHSTEDTALALDYAARCDAGVTSFLLACPTCGETRVEEMLGGERE